MKRGSLIALGLTAGTLLLVATQRRAAGASGEGVDTTPPEVQKEKVPGVTAVRIGQQFAADLSGTALGKNPSVRSPGAIFQALEDANVGITNPSPSVIAKHLETGELVSVPLANITGLS